MFITPAFAQATGPEGALGMVQLFLPLILIFGIMYFLIIRPQRQRMRQHQEMVKGLRRGDTVITAGGLIAKVTKVIDDGEIEVQLAEGVKARVVRSTIAEVRAKGEPVKEGS